MICAEHELSAYMSFVCFQFTDSQFFNCFEAIKELLALADLCINNLKFWSTSLTHRIYSSFHLILWYTIPRSPYRIVLFLVSGFASGFEYWTNNCLLYIYFDFFPHEFVAPRYISPASCYAYCSSTVLLDLLNNSRYFFPRC